MMEYEELETRAGVHPDSPKAETDETNQFNTFVGSLMNIYAAKAVHYGSYVKAHSDDGVTLFATEHFCDVKRKYVRAKTFIERMTRGEQVDFTDLLDTYSDLAVYAVMGLQMAFHCREKMQPVEAFDPSPYMRRGIGKLEEGPCDHVYSPTESICVNCGHDKSDDIPF